MRRFASFAQFAATISAFPGFLPLTSLVAVLPRYDHSYKAGHEGAQWPTNLLPYTSIVWPLQVSMPSVPPSSRSCSTRERSFHWRPGAQHDLGHAKQFRAGGSRRRLHGDSNVDGQYEAGQCSSVGIAR